MEEKLFDKNTEATLISAMVSSKEALIVSVRELNPEYFRDKTMKKLFKILVDLEGMNVPIDIITVLNRLDEINEKTITTQELNAILDLDLTGSNYRFYIDILYRYYCKRLRWNMIAEIKKAITEGEPESKIGEIIEDYEKKIQFESQSKSESICSIIEKDNINLAEITDSGGKVDIGLNVGFDSINKIFRLKRGEIYVIAGKTSMGKTSLVLKISHFLSVLEGQRILFFTLETTKRQLFEKIICQYFKISNNDLDYMDCIEKSNLYTKVYDIFHGTGNKLIVNDSTYNFRDIKLEAKLEHRKKNLGAIVIDHIGLITGNVPGDNATEKMKFITRELKILAKELDIPIIILSQLKRAHQQRDESKVPVNTDLYGGALENDACVIAFVYRPEYYELKEFAGRDKNELENLAYIVIRKNRYGPTGMVEIGFDKHSANFEELDEFNKPKWTDK